MINRRFIKENAKAAFRSNYWPIVGYYVLATLLMIAISAVEFIPVAGTIIVAVVVPVIAVGLQSFDLSLYRGEEPEFKKLFSGFTSGNKFLHVLGGYYYMELFIFLWTLLFVIPGIIKAISYSMTPYILLDEPEVSATDALKKSMEMTRGHKWEIFVFYLSFIGWELLTVLTLGLVGIFYVVPYQSMALAGIYDFLKVEYNGGMTGATEAQMGPVYETVDSVSSVEAAVEGEKFED